MARMMIAEVNLYSVIQYYSAPIVSTSSITLAMMLSLKLLKTMLL